MLSTFAIWLFANWPEFITRVKISDMIQNILTLILIFYIYNVTLVCKSLRDFEGLFGNGSFTKFEMVRKF